MPFFNNEIGQHIGSQNAAADTLLLGRTTYDTFERTFAHQTEGIALALNNVKKYVVSSTMTAANWNNSTLISANVADEVAKLKQQDGKNISITGSTTLVQSLMPHNLIDEYSLLVYPVVLGIGQRLFADGFKTDLQLIEAKPFSNGVVLMRYQPAVNS